MDRPICARALLGLLTLLLIASPLMAATITTYSSESDFYAAAGPDGLLRENFDSFDSGTPISSLRGLFFSTPNEVVEGATPIETADATGSTSSSPMALTGGS